MEILTEDNNTPTMGRFVLHETDRFTDLLSLPELSQHFALFTAFDLSEVSTDDMLRVANHLLQRGLAYACCWGEDCERWHDSIDKERASIDLELLEAGDQQNVVMTTWHDGESLTEALMFFGRMALPTPYYAENCRDYVIVASSNYCDVIRNSFRHRTFRG